MIKFEEHELTITTDVTTSKGTLLVDGVSIAGMVQHLSLYTTATEGRVKLGLQFGGASIEVAALALAVTAKVRLTGDVHRVLTALADQTEESTG